MSEHAQVDATVPFNADATQQPPRKRKRVPVACGPCRGKKSKCDGKRPSCTGCKAQGLECVYANAALPSIAMISASYLEQLEKRLETVEREVRVAKANSFSPGTTASVGNSNPSHTVHSALSVHGDDTIAEVSPDATDGVGTIEFDDRSDSMYFGPSSNIAFTRLIQRSIARAIRDLHSSTARPLHVNDESALQQRALGISRPPSPSHRLAVVDPWFSTVGNTIQEADHAFVVPPKDERVRLAKRFFSDTGVLFPYVSEANFWRMHAAAETRGFRFVRRSWLGQLNMILAMAISTDPDPSMDLATRSAMSYVYFSRAKALCMDQMMAGASIEIVQVILLMTQYLQGTRRSMQTWTIHGIAVKAALQLGLHVRDQGRPMDSIEEETRLRTWQGCVGLDRTLSMTFGRPPSILPSYVRAAPARHNLGTQEDGQPLLWSSEEKSTMFWNATFTLYQILYDVIESLYDSNAGVSVMSVAQLTTSVMQIEQKLIMWQAVLPSGLGLISSDDLAMEDSITLAKKLQVTLTLRYHNIRILAHRPVIDCYLEHRNGTVMASHEAAILQQIGHQSKVVCLQSAQAIISIVHTVSTAADVRRGFLGAWWFTLYYTLNASLTIVALLLYNLADLEPVPAQTPSDGWQQYHRLLSDAMICIPLIDGGNSLAEKCAELVGTLRNYVQGILSAGTVPLNGQVAEAWEVDDQNGQTGHNGQAGPGMVYQLLQGGAPGDELSMELARLLPDLDYDGRVYDLFDTPGAYGPMPRDLLW